MSRPSCIRVRRYTRVCMDAEKGYLYEVTLDPRRRRARGRRLARLIPRYAFGCYCRWCAHPLPRSVAVCPAHSSDREYLNRTLAVGLYYTDSVKTGIGLLGNLLTDYILALKQRRSYASVLGAAMALVVREKVYGIGVEDIDVVTFVPKHPSELKMDEENEVRYNQAELLARAASKHLRLRLERLVEKTAPLQLRGRGLHERYKESKQVYHVLEEQADIIRDSRILLVDDVRTTGATGNTIAALLKKHGARRVYLLVAGRATYYDLVKEIVEEYGGDPEIG
ncbi:MAG TPA: ComF family protein [Pyrodictium sp.]|nr:ComF family protein [Pyrodictium sp.]